jgi:hypothetical protein
MVRIPPASASLGAVGDSVTDRKSGSWMVMIEVMAGRGPPVQYRESEVSGQ